MSCQAYASRIQALFIRAVLSAWYKLIGTSYHNNGNSKYLSKNTSAFVDSSNVYLMILPHATLLAGMTAKFNLVSTMNNSIRWKYSNIKPHVIRLAWLQILIRLLIPNLCNDSYLLFMEINPNPIPESNRNLGQTCHHVEWFNVLTRYAMKMVWTSWFGLINSIG